MCFIFINFCSLLLFFLNLCLSFLLHPSSSSHSFRNSPEYQILVFHKCEISISCTSDTTANSVSVFPRSTLLNSSTISGYKPSLRPSDCFSSTTLHSSPDNWLSTFSRHENSPTRWRRNRIMTVIVIRYSHAFYTSVPCIITSQVFNQQTSLAGIVQILFYTLHFFW